MRKLIALLLAATVTPCAAQDYGAHHFGSLIIDSPPTFSSLTGLTQCLQVNTSGVVSGTGAACGGGGGYTLPTASISTLGGVKVDGSTITINGSGVISSAGGYTLPAATSSTLGGVKPDGTTLTNSSGAISVTYGTVVATAAQGNDSRIVGAVQTGGALGTPSSGTLTNATGLPIGGISATGTPSSSTFLRGDGSWQAVGGGSISLPQTIAGTVTSGGIPYFNSTTQMSSSAALAASALVVGGGAGVAPSTITTGANIVTALGSALNGSGAIVGTTSPALVTPALGVATGTSLALGGATIGTNALAVTGTSLMSNPLSINLGATTNITSLVITSGGGTTDITLPGLGIGHNGSSVFFNVTNTQFLLQTYGTSAQTLSLLTQAADVIIGPGSNVFNQRNTTYAQAHRIYNAFTNITNYTFASIVAGQTAGLEACPAATLCIGSYSAGSSGGTNLTKLGIYVDNTLKADYGATTANTWTFAGSGGIVTASTTLHTTSVALTNGAAAAAGTLTNAPAAGNPTKWIPINDNGTTRYIPAW